MSYRCDLCLEKNTNPLFNVELSCGHMYCVLCRYKRKDLLRKNICLVCLVDDKRYSSDEIKNFNCPHASWVEMRYEDVKINL